MKPTVLVLIVLLTQLSQVFVAFDVSGRDLEIKGAKISRESDAWQAARRYYYSLPESKRADEWVNQEASIVILGFDIPGFAKTGEKIWEARVVTLNNELRAILWIHPMTEKVFVVIAFWKQ